MRKAIRMKISEEKQKPAKGSQGPNGNATHTGWPYPVYRGMRFSWLS